MVKKTDINNNIIEKIDEITKKEDMRNFLKDALQVEYTKKGDSERAFGKEYSILLEKYGKK